MNMKKINYILALLLSVTILTSCDYGDENVDPTRPSGADVDLRLVLPTAQTQAAFNNMASVARLSGILMQHFDGFDAQQIEYMIYDINENTLDNFWNTGLYGGVMKDCIVLMEKGTEAEFPHYVGIAKILMANALGTATSIWGDVPYSNAFLGTEDLKPSYDSQESVYAAIQTLLDEAIVEMSTPTISGGPSDDDLIFGGDASKWITAAYALKARYFMHLTKRDASAHTKALAAIANAMSSSADQPDFVFDASATFSNPFAQFGDQRPNTMVMNPAFEASLSGDPRAGMISSGGDFYTDGTGGLFWSSNDSPSPLISYTEIKFLEAEALALSGNLAGASDALDSAVSENMRYMGIDNNSGSRMAYLTAIPDLSGMSTDNALAVIINESYVGLYGQAELEIWTNYRRTGYPALTPNPQGKVSVIPRRIIYAQNERITNEASLSAAIAAQGGAQLDDYLWAFKN